MNLKTVLLVLGGLAVLFLALGGIPMLTSKVVDMARAIQEFEGWFPGSVSYRNNNPGNLKFAGQPGATGKDNQGHAIFDTFESGWNALINQVRIAVEGRSRVYNPDMTLLQFFQKYAEANSLPYAQFVAIRLGVKTNDTLKEALIERA